MKPIKQSASGEKKSNIKKQKHPKLYTYRYPRPALTVDLVIFSYLEGKLSVLFIQRANEPFQGKWALPGGFVDEGELLVKAAERELKEETGLECPTLQQLSVFDDPKRDPRERIISVAYYGLIQPENQSVQGASDATEARWYPIDHLPKLAFDHLKILRKALEQLRRDVQFGPLGFALMNSEFSLSHLQSLYENILGKSLDKRNFRKKILSTGILISLEKKAKGVPFRAPQLYQLDSKQLKNLRNKRFDFKID